MRSDKKSGERAHARLVSLGGLILAGLIILFAFLTYDAFVDPAPNHWVQLLLASFLGIVLLYGLDAWSESLSLQGTDVVFNSLFKQKRVLDLCRYSEISIIHEGLNQEKGVISLLFRGPEREERFSLGPLWRHRELENFFVETESITKACKLVSSVR